MDGNALFDVHDYQYKVYVPGTVRVDGKKPNEFFGVLEKKGWKDAHKDELLRAYLVIGEELSEAKKTEYSYDTVLKAMLNHEGNFTEQEITEKMEALKPNIAKLAKEYANVNYVPARDACQYINSMNLVPEQEPQPEENQNLEENQIQEGNQNQENLNQEEQLREENREEIRNQQNPEEHVQVEQNNQVEQVVEQPVQVEQEDPNLIKIIDKNKIVDGHNWEQFAQKFTEKGWENAKNDNTVRALFNLCSEGQPNITEWAKSVLNREQPLIGIAADFTISFSNTVASDILDKAKNNQEFFFEENQRASVLHFQQLQANLGYHYDFNAAHPAPQPVAQNANVAQEENNLENENNAHVENNVQNENNIREENNIQNENPELNENLNINEEQNLQPNQNNVVHQENVEIQNQEIQNNEENIIANDIVNNENRVEQVNQEQPVVQEQQQPAAEEHKRPVRDNTVIKAHARRIMDALDAATLRARGSDEYKYAREEYRKVQEKWNAAMERGNGKILEEDLNSLRGDLRNVLYLQDAYLGKKIKDKDKSSNASKRISAQTDAFDLIEEQIYALDVRAEEIEKEAAPAVDALANKSAQALAGINNAKLFARGSDEYKAATEAFEKYNRKMAEISKKYAGKEGDITTAELEELEELAQVTDDVLSDYSAKKLGETISENTHKRTDAVYNARTTVQASMRRFKELQAEKDAQPAEQMNILKGRANTGYVAILDAEQDVHFGSKAYENAKNDYKAVVDHVAGIENEGEELERRQLDDMAAIVEKGIKSIDAYLVTKKGQELSEKTQKRVDAMREAKENLLNLKKKHAEIDKARRANQMNISDEALEAREQTVKDELSLAQNRVNGNKVWFGGSDYDKALELYSKTMHNEALRDQARKEIQPSISSLEGELKELNEAKKATLVYIERKEKEIRDSKKPLDYKGQKRLEEMKNAYNALNVRIDKAESKIDTMKGEVKTNQEKQMKDLLEEKRAAIPGKKGLEKIVAMDSASAVKSLYEISKQKTLTKGDPSLIRHCAATLLMEQCIKDKMVSGPIPGTKTSYGKLVSKIANSEEFKALLPDNDLSPEKCKTLLTDPKALKSISRKFLDSVQKTAAKEKSLSVSVNRNLNQNQPEAVQQPGPHVK